MFNDNSLCINELHILHNQKYFNLGYDCEECLFIIKITLV